MRAEERNSTETVDVEEGTSSQQTKNSFKRPGTPLMSANISKMKIVVPDQINEDESVNDSNEDAAMDVQADDEAEADENDDAFYSKLISFMKKPGGGDAIKKKLNQLKPKNESKTIINKLGSQMKKNVKGVAPKKPENLLLKELCKKIGKVGGDRIVTMLADIPEGIEYPIDAIRCFIARNDRAVVTVEFGERVLYLPFQYKNFMLDEVFCVDHLLRPLKSKRSVYPIKNNELICENLYFKVEKSPETNYAEWHLFQKT